MNHRPTFLAALFVALVSPFLRAAERPNVLLIITDDQGYGDLSCHGNPHLKTPNLDAFSAQSARFDRFFVSPLCAPTRASLLTGRYSLRTGVSGVSSGTETMRSEETTIAELLKGTGYRTGLFGKWHNGEHFPHTPQGQGFDEFFGYTLGHWNNYFDTTLKHNGKWEKTKGFIVDALTEQALRFMETKKDQPFFCMLSYTTPHSPFQCPDKYFDEYKAKGLNDYLACVYGMCANIDDNVGRVLAHLDKQGLRENTIVIFMTDNGPNGARFNGGMRGTKGSPHEGGNRVPFFLRYPARFKPLAVPRIAAHIDILPTLAELCGVTLPKERPLDGKSLVPLLEGNSAGWPERTLFFQHALPGPKGQARAAVRSERYRLVKEGKEWELFDMQTDPGQATNIAADKPEVANQLKDAFQEWAESIQPELRKERLPIPVGHPEENPVELPTPQSRFDGGLRFSGKHPNNAWLVGWTNPAATVEWDLDVAQAGGYTVTLLYSCAAEDAGSKLRISAADAAIDTEVMPAPLTEVPSPDRVPRDEVYEMKWSKLPAGVLHLPKGKTTVKLQAVSKAGKEVMQLKSVLLEKK